MDNKLQFKIDYLNGIVPITRVDSFFESLKNINYIFDIQYWVNQCFAVRGIRNYNTRLHYQGKNDFIVAWNAVSEYDTFIAKNPEEHKYNPYIYISLSGSALDLFSENELSLFVQYLYRVGFKCTRLDVACDIYNRDNVIVPYILQSFKFNSRQHKPEGVPFITSKMSLEPKKIKSTGRYKRPVQYINVSDFNGNTSTNLTFGDHSSDCGMFRMYDKYIERGFDVEYGGSDILDDFHRTLYPDSYWYRLEVELHKKHAKMLFDLWADKKLPVYDLFASAICCMFEVRLSRSNGYRVNDCAISPVWQSFLNELSNNIHFVELNKTTVPVVELPIEELKERFIHYAPMLCAFEDLCIYDDDFRIRVLHSERYRYENKIQYQYLRQMLEQEQFRRQCDNAVAV